MQAQSLDIQQAIDTALEVAGLRFRVCLSLSAVSMQAQSLDIRQAIDTALEAAGPRYRAHYAEWGAVHYHSAQAESGV